MSKKINKTKEQTSQSRLKLVTPACRQAGLPLKKGEVLKKQGFTLFELLVSISIIAILTAVAVVSFSGMNKKTRDTRRTSDVEKIRVALESYKQINGSYPTLVSDLVTGKFLDKEPTDPKTNSVYSYTRDSISSYHLCAAVELVGSTTPNTVAPICTGTTPSGGYYRAIQP
jgi:prepilin-type N-terminal cleavage/methylation domain-containing protein